MHMKPLLIFALASLAIALTPQVVDARGAKAIDPDQTERRRDGLTYELGSETPLTGLVRDVYSKRKKKSEISYVGGMKEGLSIRWHENGNKQSEENFVSGRLHGVVTRWWPNGEKQFSGYFESGRPVRLRTNWFASGHKKSEDTLVNGISNGLSTTWFENGNKSREGTAINGQLDGLVTLWYENGQKRIEENYVLGKKNQDGPVTEWYDNGQKLAERTYVDGQLHGVETLWNSQGGVTAVKNYVHGAGTQVEYAEFIYRPNGQVRQEVRWYDGIRHETDWYENLQKKIYWTYHTTTRDGHRVEWHENGEQKLDVGYVGGLREGLRTEWHENGQKKVEGNFVHGKKEGVHTLWDADGNATLRCYARDEMLNEGHCLAAVPPEPTDADRAGVAASLIEIDASKLATDVTYGMLHGTMRIWNTAIQSVSDGTISRTLAVVSPGASVRMTGDWRVGPVIDDSYCPGCVIQIYLAWLPGAATNDAWPPSKGLWSGMSNTHTGPSANGSFDWTSMAPAKPGLYHIGRGQTLDFDFRLPTEGKMGYPTDGPATEPAASFVIQVRE